MKKKSVAIWWPNIVLCVAELPASAVIEQRLTELLCHDQMKHPKLAINLAQGCPPFLILGYQKTFV